MKVIGYIRSAHDGPSPMVQEAGIREYCEKHHLDLLGFEGDDGHPGDTLDRPGIRRALALLDNDEADGLIVLQLDRLSRNVVDYSSLVEKYFRKGRKTFISVDEGFDLSTTGGRLCGNLIMAMAQRKLEIQSEQ